MIGGSGAGGSCCIDSNAINDYVAGMSTTLTIRNLDAEVKRKLRLRAASHQQSMEAEVREILASTLADKPETKPDQEAAKTERRKRIEAVMGIWKDRYEGKTTDEIMKELRGDE